MAYELLDRLPDPNYNGGPGFRTLSVIDNVPGMVHTLNDGSSIGVKFAGNYWTLTVTYPQLTPEQAAPLLNFLSKVTGGFTNFYVSAPGWGDAGNSATVEDEGKLSIPPNGANKLAFTAGSLSRTYSAGDVIKLSNSNKIYKVLDVESTTLTLNCDIVNPNSIATAGIQPEGVLFRCRATNVPKPVLNAEGLYESMTLTMRENIR